MEIGKFEDYGEEFYHVCYHFFSYLCHFAYRFYRILAKKRNIAKNIGAGYETDAEFVKAGKIKKYSGYVCLASLVLGGAAQGSQTIDVVKNLFGLVFCVALVTFLYYWRKQSSARKDAGGDYSNDERYLHFGKLKKIAGGICLVGLIAATVIPDSPEEAQKKAETHAKYEAQRERERAEEQAKKEAQREREKAEEQAKKEVEMKAEQSKQETSKPSQNVTATQKEYSKWQCGYCTNIVIVEGNDPPLKSGCPKSNSGNHQWAPIKKHIKQ